MTNAVQSFVASASGRLDRVLSEQTNQSRNQIEKLITQGDVSVDGKVIVKRSFRVEEGMEIGYIFRDAAPSKPQPIDFDVEILYEDEDVLVVNKPSGVVVHPAPSYSGATLVDWLKFKKISLSTLSGEERHGIVHRIDKETTGALLVAKNNHAHQNLSLQLQDKSMGRYYLAIVDRALKGSCVVDKPIARSRKNRLRMDVIEGGKEAKSAFEPIARLTNDCELIAAKLYTGRTHQIRVHLRELQRHILGDSLYGFKSKSDKISRVYLHAALLYFIHPVSGKRVNVYAPLHEDMRRYLSHYGYDYAPQANEIESLFKESPCHI